LKVGLGKCSVLAVGSQTFREPHQTGERTSEKGAVDNIRNCFREKFGKEPSGNEKLVLSKSKSRIKKERFDRPCWQSIHM
jgi:hypothetical protein